MIVQIFASVNYSTDIIQVEPVELACSKADTRTTGPLTGLRWPLGPMKVVIHSSSFLESLVLIKDWTVQQHAQHIEIGVINDKDPEP
jgi:hypothetical protein